MTSINLFLKFVGMTSLLFFQPSTLHLCHLDVSTPDRKGRFEGWCAKTAVLERTCEAGCGGSDRDNREITDY